MTIVRASLQTLVEVMPISDIYADGIGQIENLGDCFRMIFYTYSKPLEGGAQERVVVAKIIRPKKSILRGDKGAVTEWLEREARTHEARDGFQS